MNESAKQQIGDRLRIFRESKKLSQAQLAATLGGTTKGLQNNELNIALPNSKVLIGLYDLGMNINWLLSGEGPMLLEELKIGTDSEAVLRRYGEALEVLELALQKLGKTMPPAKKRAAVDALYRATLGRKVDDPGLAEALAILAA